MLRLFELLPSQVKMRIVGRMERLGDQNILVGRQIRSASET